MYTFTKRFARLRRTCRCAFCQAAARANSRVGSTRWGTASFSTESLRQLLQVPYLQSSTLYMTIFAFGMGIDGDMKRNRRHKWDLAIAHEKTTISQLTKEEQKLKQKLSGKPAFGEISSVENEKSFSIPDFWNLQDQAVTGPVLPNRMAVADPLPKREAFMPSRKTFALYPKHMNNEKNSREVVEELSDWQKAYQASPYEDGVTLPSSSATTGPRQQTNNIDPQSIYAQPSLRRLQDRRCWTPKKLRFAEVVTARLVLELMLQVELYGAVYTKNKSSKGIEKRINQPIDDKVKAKLPERIYVLSQKSKMDLLMLEMRLCQAEKALRDIDPWDSSFDNNLPEITPEYSQDDQGKYLFLTKALNQDIHQVFKDHVAGKIDFKTAIALVCNRLLTSTVAPNMHTYNILLVEITSLSSDTHRLLFSPKLATVTASSSLTSTSTTSSFTNGTLTPQKIAPLVNALFKAIRAAKIRVNEITLVALLKHYTARNDADSFTHLIRLMRGHGSGLVLARQDVSLHTTRKAFSHLLPKEARSEKIIQAVIPTATVAEAVMEGLVHFVGVDGAVRHMGNFGTEGWAVCERGLAVLIRRCSEEKKWAVGVRCWEKILELVPEKSDSGNQRTNSSAARIRPSLTAYRAYIALCWRCGETENLRRVVCEAVESHGYAVEDVLNGMGEEEQEVVRLFQEPEAPIEEEGSDSTKGPVDFATKHHSKPVPHSGRKSSFPSPTTMFTLQPRHRSNSESAGADVRKAPVQLDSEHQPQSSALSAPTSIPSRSQPQTKPSSLSLKTTTQPPPEFQPQEFQPRQIANTVHETTLNTPTYLPTTVSASAIASCSTETASSKILVPARSGYDNSNVSADTTVYPNAIVGVREVDDRQPLEGSLLVAGL